MIKLRAIGMRHGPSASQRDACHVWQGRVDLEELRDGQPMRWSTSQQGMLVSIICFALESLHELCIGGAALDPALRVAPALGASRLELCLYPARSPSLSHGLQPHSGRPAGVCQSSVLITRACLAFARDISLIWRIRQDTARRLLLWARQLRRAPGFAKFTYIVGFRHGPHGVMQWV